MQVDRENPVSGFMSLMVAAARFSHGRAGGIQIAHGTPP